MGPGRQTGDPAATEECSLLDREFTTAGRGIERIVREWICDEFRLAASAYGIRNADGEELPAGQDG
ncbi:DUF5713 family protein [Streptomyces gardneri]|uniref:DUF5713 family protein n=1 Tax=Streptomyces gardneri TaxID=66892 RepID=UPI0035DB1437